MKRLRFALLLTPMVIASCGGSGSVADLAGLSVPRSTVRIEVTHDGRPLATAHVRAIPLDSGPVPLPVSVERLVEAKYATVVSTTTDAQGRASLDLFEHLPHLIEVSPNPFDPKFDEGPWTWTIDPRSLTLDSVGSNASASLKIIKAGVAAAQ